MGFFPRVARGEFSNPVCVPTLTGHHPLVWTMSGVESFLALRIAQMQAMPYKDLLPASVMMCVKCDLHHWGSVLHMKKVTSYPPTVPENDFLGGPRPHVYMTTKSARMHDNQNLAYA